MRVLIQTDMEGISQVTDFRELLPLCRHYWRTGREKLTDEVAVAAAGLLEGGATEVLIDDQHLGIGQNIIAERLPEGVCLPRPAWIYRQLQAGAFDAVFQVGRHARWGTNGGFVAHTQMPNVAFAVDGRPITESHICAFRAGAPVLGVTGDDRLGPQLDGALAGTPFLAVKRSSGLTMTQPVDPDLSRVHDAIHAFAAQCARDWRVRSRPPLPRSFMLAASLAPELAGRLEGRYGLRRESACVVSVRCGAWWHDAEPATQAATAAVARPFVRTLTGLDLSSEAALASNDPDAVEEARRQFSFWLLREQRAWYGGEVG